MDKLKKTELTGTLSAIKIEIIFMVYGIFLIGFCLYDLSRWFLLVIYCLVLCVLYLIGRWLCNRRKLSRAGFQGDFCDLVIMLQEQGFELKAFNTNLYIFHTLTRFLPNYSLFVYMDKEGFTILGTKGVLEWFARNNKEFKLIEKSNN